MPDTLMKRILICDDHAVIRSGVKIILSSEFENIELGEARSGKECLQKIRQEKWNLLILDLEMPGKNGLEILEQLKAEGLNIPVIIFSMYPEEQIALRVIKTGASGFVSKSAEGNELAEAVRTVLSGRKYITPSLSEQMVSYLESPSGKPPHELLSNREYQTLVLIGKGKTTSEIAQELSVSVSTVGSFRARILEKMNLKTTADLVKYAVSNKLV